MSQSNDSKKGTILKVPSGHFTTEELEELWSELNKKLEELQEPSQRYSRHTSDLIKSLRDIILGDRKEDYFNCDVTTDEKLYYHIWN